ncbi:hypothetical protein BU15DRAFT_64850 [Melanogaster broomeanus]|nr:hypothetical protein BU15DRAFT_64850 [Melanogaster broomeanus]
MTPELKERWFYKPCWILWPVVAQLCIFILACGWLGEVTTRECISFNSYLTEMIFADPRISTTVVTLVATALSLASAALLGLSVKEAARHMLRKPRKLAEVSAGVALIGGSLWFKRKHLGLSLIALFVYVVFQLLVTGGLEGVELNITSPEFAESLAVELGTFASNIMRDDTFPLLNVGGAVSGISAAGISFGVPGIINFNQAKYNLSTRGVLPAIQSFAGATAPPSPVNGTKLQFSGGATIVNNNVTAGPQGSMNNWFGIQTNYTVDQQGITADINCQAADNNTLNLNLNLTNLNTTVAVNSPGSSIAFQQYVTSTNASEPVDGSGTGFLSTVICPGHINGSDVYSTFGQSFSIFTPQISLTEHGVPVIATQGFDKYDFLPSTVCEVTPFVTTTRVDYIDGGTINPSQILMQQSFSPNDTELLFYLASVANYHARNSQGLANNIIGDTLYAVYSGRYNTTIGSNSSEVYRELEDYWRGVIEFSGTFLRAGYSAQNAFPGGEIPSNMTSRYNGTMSVLTVGWGNGGAIYVFSILPLGIITLLSGIAAFYSLIASYKHPDHKTLLDISDPLHLIMTIAKAPATGNGGSTVGAGGLTKASSAWELHGFDSTIHDENVQVKLGQQSNQGHTQQKVSQDQP